MLLVGLASCQREIDGTTVTGKVELDFTQMVGAQPLTLNMVYNKPDGEDFLITKLKYYISNISLVDSAGYRHSIPDQYFLVDKSSAESQKISVNVDAGKYTAISFMIGVDSLRNVSGAQDGALDPVLDMFWTWNTGYIMAKMEGTSSYSTLPNNRIEYHIGGFKGSEKVQRLVQIPFGQTMPVTEGKTLKIDLQADIMKWFNGMYDLTITQNPTCTSPGLLASRYADNYSTMFTLNSIQSQ